MKTCVKCGYVFYKRNCNACQKIIRKNYYENNKEKIAALSKIYREKNKENLKKAWEKRRIRDEEKILKRWKDYKAKNVEKIKKQSAIYRQKNKVRINKNISEWKKQNRETVRVYFHNRYSSIKTSGKLSVDIIEKLFNLQKGKCACCKKPLGDDYHLDHIMPLSAGGPNIDSNVQLLRARCNLEKSNKHPIIFMQERGFLL